MLRAGKNLIFSSSCAHQIHLLQFSYPSPSIPLWSRFARPGKIWGQYYPWPSLQFLCRAEDGIVFYPPRSALRQSTCPTFILLSRKLEISSLFLPHFHGLVGNRRYSLPFSRAHWSIRVRSDPNNVAYSGKPIGLHTDLSYYSDPPGVGLFHCIQQFAGCLIYF